jgi:hypothetical protein
MGLGHMRAAYALRDCAGGTLLIDGSPGLCSPEEIRLWNLIRSLYYFLSRAGDIPVVGSLLFRLLHIAQEIPGYYPARDLSAASAATGLLRWLAEHGPLGSSLEKQLAGSALPAVNTFYASAMALDYRTRRGNNYLIICDADFHRVWVAHDPRKSNVRYIAPARKVKQRLLSYGVPESRIYLTGFPLPKENLGRPDTLETLRRDLFARLVRLDPYGQFFSVNGSFVEYYLVQSRPAAVSKEPLRILFAIGGSGVQARHVRTLLFSLKDRIIAGEAVIYLSAGIRPDICRLIRAYLDEAGLSFYENKSVFLIYNADIRAYFDSFNAALRVVDILWTKPSELSFYCALGLPILMTEPIGSHEARNSRWLQDIHAGINPPGPLEYAHEWLFDLRASGIFAEAAWDGFLKGRKLGTYKIERLLAAGGFEEGDSPLTR